MFLELLQKSFLFCSVYIFFNLVTSLHILIVINCTLSLSRCIIIIILYFQADMEFASFGQCTCMSILYIIDIVSLINSYTYVCECILIFTSFACVCNSIIDKSR